MFDLRQYRTIRWQRRRCLFRHLLLADFRFTSSKPSKSAIASDEKFIRLRTNSFVRYCLNLLCTTDPQNTLVIYVNTEVVFQVVPDTAVTFVRMLHMYLLYLLCNLMVVLAALA